MINTAPVCEIEIIDKAKVKSTKAKLPAAKDSIKMADIFKLLGDQTRLKIIFALIENELCVCDLSAVINSKVSAVSHQLRLLRGAKLVKFRKDGKMVFYSLDDEHVKTLVEQLKVHVNE